MVEYIERDALFRKIDGEPFYDNADRDEVVLPLIDSFPSSDVVPVRYGHWTKVDASYWKWKYDGPHVVRRVKYRHDECGKVSLNKENYCPGCGAKMQ